MDRPRNIATARLVSLRLGIAAGALFALGAVAAPVFSAGGAGGSSAIGAPQAPAEASPVASGASHGLRALALPILTLSPDVGPPGTVVTVTGQNFLYHAVDVELLWSTGAQYLPRAPVRIANDGSFRTQVMVVYGDSVYGPRYLRARIPGFGYESIATQATFLVVERTAGPPVSTIVHTIWGSRPPFFLRQ